jgi:hypothetical protein
VGVYEALTACARHFAEQIPSPSNTLWLERLANRRETVTVGRDDLAGALGHVDHPSYHVYGAADRMLRFVVGHDDSVAVLHWPAQHLVGHVFEHSDNKGLAP